MSPRRGKHEDDTVGLVPPRGRALGRRSNIRETVPRRQTVTGGGEGRAIWRSSARILAMAPDPEALAKKARDGEIARVRRSRGPDDNFRAACVRQGAKRPASFRSGEPFSGPIPLQLVHATGRQPAHRAPRGLAKARLLCPALRLCGHRRHQHA